MMLMSDTHMLPATISPTRSPPAMAMRIMTSNAVVGAEKRRVTGSVAISHAQAASGCLMSSSGSVAALWTLGAGAACWTNPMTFLRVGLYVAQSVTGSVGIALLLYVAGSRFPVASPVVSTIVMRLWVDGHGWAVTPALGGPACQRTRRR